MTASIDDEMCSVPALIATVAAVCGLLGAVAGSGAVWAACWAYGKRVQR